MRALLRVYTFLRMLAISIQRYNPAKGEFETATYDTSGQPLGVDFLIVPGEGYFVYMKK